MRNTILGVIRQRGKIVWATNQQQKQRTGGGGGCWLVVYPNAPLAHRRRRSPSSPVSSRVLVLVGAKVPNAGLGSPDFYIFLFGQFAQLQKVVDVHFLIITFSSIQNRFSILVFLHRGTHYPGFSTPNPLNQITHNKRSLTRVLSFYLKHISARAHTDFGSFSGRTPHARLLSHTGPIPSW